MKLYYLALMMTLALPDICAALESPDGESSGKQYKNWYNANLQRKFQPLTAVDVWKLRCGVLHQGRVSHPDMQFERVIFTLPGRGFIHGNIFDRVLNLDLTRFCNDVMQSVRDWLGANQTNPNVIKNLPNLVQFRPHGLPPSMIGMPVIT